MAQKTIEGEASSEWVERFLEKQSLMEPFGMENRLGASGKVFTRRVFDLLIPWRFWKTALLGDGGDYEPVLMAKLSDGEITLTASERMLRFIDRELENTRSRI